MRKFNRIVYKRYKFFSCLSLLKMTFTLYFANAFNFKNQVLKIRDDYKRLVNEKELSDTQSFCIALDCRYCITVDSTAIHAIKEIVSFLGKDKYKFCLFNVRSDIQKRFKKMIERDEIEVFSSYDKVISAHRTDEDIINV